MIVAWRAQVQAVMGVVRQFTKRFEKPIWAVLAIALLASWAGTHAWGWPSAAWTLPWAVTLLYLAVYVYYLGSRYLWMPLFILAMVNISDTLRHL